MSVRRVRPDGAPGDLVGFVLAGDAEGLRLRDRRGRNHQLAWSHVQVWRTVGVARGRDPVRTPLAELDRLAGSAGTGGRTFVARLSDLLDLLDPVPLQEWADPPPAPARLEGEWVSTVWSPELIAVLWWATHHDARSVQVRTGDDGIAARLLALGFHERTRDAEISR
ncbi:hypothetical protein [Propionicimonas sp.]|uniref:hypothetical protein n=1 Tax=Propionicimonas sp. TaxID=1955623 RepID=UPI0039E21C56